MIDERIRDLERKASVADDPIAWERLARAWQVATGEPFARLERLIEAANATASYHFTKEPRTLLGAVAPGHPNRPRWWWAWAPETGLLVDKTTIPGRVFERTTLVLVVFDQDAQLVTIGVGLSPVRGPSPSKVWPEIPNKGRSRAEFDMRSAAAKRWARTPAEDRVLMTTEQALDVKKAFKAWKRKQRSAVR